MKVYIKDWFINKIDRPWYLIIINDGSIVKRETEKAYLLKITCETADGESETSITSWVPKSCTMTEEEHEAFLAEEAKKAEAQRQRYEDGCQRYEALVKFAKDHLVKGVRSGMRKETILNKIAQAGLEYVY